MSKINELLNQRFEPIDPDAIIIAFEKRLDKFGFDNITVEDVEVDMEGNILVSFSDLEGEDYLEALFVYDEDEGAQVFILDDDAEAADVAEDDDAEHTVIDLSALAPSVISPRFSNIKYINLADLSWLNKSTLASIFVAGDIEGPSSVANDATDGPMQMGLFRALESLDIIDSIDERAVYAIRGGKRVKLGIVRKVRRKKMSAKAKAGVRRGVRKRKIKRFATARKRKKSLKVRRRTGLKNQKLSKFRKVQGTANRKR